MNTVYQEVVSLPFSSESQGTISKNSFSCLMNIVICDRGVGRRTPFIQIRNCDKTFVRVPFCLFFFIFVWQ
ncbi:hypothetical protein E6L37_09835 [Enterococcus lactis]|uniref:Uncharacterized protein n=1 Tax=Enterococcus faecium TaxID=1352 RepID=A0A7V7GNC7_ENTFC|nr:hypothetical protein D9Z05_11090 [Enterococcus faecium]TKA99403.1 hypothetical protein E6L37_09835 [Enterococcus lactis]EGP5687292.1 hypothetical protein [Enterococcus faecium]KAA0691057.1 hypothetical protein DTX73_05965 [Enterococcus faecium]PHL16412.1 hypothetical protein CQR38_02920 [Enterococcus faecium]